MKAIRHHKLRAAIVLAVLLASSALVPILSNPLDAKSSDATHEPPDLFKAAIGRASQTFDDVAGTGEIHPLLDQSVVDVPATFFRDRFDDGLTGGTNEDDRIGGFGHWVANDGWSLDEEAAGKQVGYGYDPAPRCIRNETLQDPCTPTIDAAVHDRNDIQQGYRFGGADGYHIPSAGFTTVDTPLISLRSLPISLPPQRSSVPGYGGVTLVPGVDETAGTADETDLTLLKGAVIRAPVGTTTVPVNVGATGGPSDPGHIVLYIDHRFNLAFDPAALGTASTVGNAIRNAAGTPLPQAVDQALGDTDDGVADTAQSALGNTDDGAGDTVQDAIEKGWGLSLGESHFASVMLETEQNRRIRESTGTFNIQQLQPLRARNTVTLGSPSIQIDPTDSPPLVFSGSQREFTEEAFDLTPWAGQDVHLYFRVDTSQRDEPSDFNDDTLFDTEAGFYGWDVSNVRIEGPAHRHNLRLDRMVHPVVDGDNTMLRPGDDVFTVLLLNRGQVLEDDVYLTASAQVRNAEGEEVDSITCPVDPSLLADLLPGEAREVELRRVGGAPCFDVQPSLIYEIVLDAGFTGAPRDMYRADNQLTFTGRGQPPDIRLQDRVSASPSLANIEQPVMITAMLMNHGLDPETVCMTMRVDWTPIRPGSATETGVEGNWSLVQVAEAPDCDTVVAPGTSQGAAWTMSFMKPGIYSVEVDAANTDGDPFFTEKKVTVGVLKAPEFAYKTSFDGLDEVQTAKMDGDWTIESGIDTRPPCFGSVADCDLGRFLELPRVWTGEADPALVALRGQLEPDQDRLDTQIDALRVEFTHYVQDLRCKTTGCQGGTDSRLSVRFTDGPGPAVMPRPTSQAAPAPQQPNTAAAMFTTGILAVGGREADSPPTPGNPSRNAYYNGQWIAEDLTVSATSVLFEGPPPSLDGSPPSTQVSAGRLADVALEFVLSSASLDPSQTLNCPSRSEYDRACPVWRIANMRVTGITDGQEAMVLLEWSGAAHDRRGAVSSYFATPAQAQAGVQGIFVYHPSPIPFLAPLSGDELAPYTDDDETDHPLDEHTEGGHPADDTVARPFPVVANHTANSTLRNSFIELYEALRLHEQPAWSNVTSLLNTFAWPQINATVGNRTVVGDGGLPVNCPTITILLGGDIWMILCLMLLASYYGGTEEDPRRTPISQDDDWATLDGCERQGLEAETDRRFRCPTWVERPVADLHAREPTWNEQTGFYTHAADLSVEEPWFRYSDPAAGTLDFLISPVLEIPSKDGITLEIDHWFRFHPYGRDEIGPMGYTSAQSTSPSFADSGMLMVRFVQPDDLTKKTPFLPIQASPFFMGCSEGIQMCSSDSLLDSTLVPLSLELNDLFVHDYRTGTHGEVDLTKCDDGEPLPIGGIADLEHSCWVQFAFRLEVPPKISNQTQAARDIARQSQFDAEGWFIDGMRISESSIVPFDLAIHNVDIEKTRYDWRRLGLGPGSKATANITVQNNGAFALSDIAFHVILQRPGQEPLHFIERPEAFSVVAREGLGVDAGEAAPTNWALVPFEIPDHEGTYKLAFCAYLEGQLEPGLLQLDRRLDDNCMALEHLRPQANARFEGRGILNLVEQDGVQGYAVDLTKFNDRVNVRPNPVLDFELKIEPKLGQKSDGVAFRRTMDITIINSGNVVVRDAVLERSIVAANGLQNDETTWRIVESPARGDDASWTDLTLTDDDGKLKAPQASIFLTQSGQYFVTVSVKDCQGCSETVRLESIDTLYSDTFLPNGAGIHTDFNVHERMQVLHDAWRAVTDKGIDGTPVRMLRFGDPAINQYPDNADAVLALPPLDLSSFRSASLSLMHNYDFEEGYDGARAEVCVGQVADCGDDGPWQVLHPESGSLGRVAVHGPFVPDNDPMEEDLVGAFTGNSTARPLHVDGWVLDEFDLSNIPGFRRDVTFERFGLDHLVGARDDVRRTDANWNPRASWHQTWGNCPDDCWYRENLNKLNPAPFANQPYWWTGNVGATHSGDDRTNPQTTPAASTWLNVTVDASDLGIQSNQQTRFVFSYWKDTGGELLVSDPDNKVSDCESASFTFVCVDGGRTDLWDEHSEVIEVTSTSGTRSKYNLSLEYKDPGTRLGQSSRVSYHKDYFEPTRGAAIGYLRLEVFGTIEGEPVVFKCVDVLLTSCPNGVSGVDTPISIKGVENLSWTLVNAADATPEDWGIAEGVETHTGDRGKVWRFGHPIEDDELERTTYEPNAWERLVTPRISLADVVGDTILFSYWEREDLAWSCDRSAKNSGLPTIRTLVQVITPGPKGDVVDDWMELATRTPSDHNRNHQECGDHETWRPVEFDLSEIEGLDVKGKDVRFAFEIETPRIALHPELDDSQPVNNADWRLGDGADSDGYSWMIDAVTVTGGSMVGEPVQLRLRAATDDSIHEGHWKIQEFQVVGIPYSSNVAVLPDAELEGRSIRWDKPLDLSGLVRNLGTTGGATVSLQLGTHKDNEDLLPEITLCVAQNCQTETGSATVELSVDGAGDPFDRVPYTARVTFSQVPGENSRQQYEFMLRLVDSQGRPISDGNIGDHERQFIVHVQDVQGLLEGELRVHPPTVAVDEPTTLDLDVSLAGDGDSPTLLAEVGVTITATRLDEDEDSITLHSSVIEALDPDDPMTLQVPWQSPQRGFYRLHATLTSADTQAPQIHRYAHVMVGDSPLFFADDFAERPSTNGWGMSCGQLCWGDSTIYAQTERSLFIGSETPGGFYNAGTAIAVTPRIDSLAWLLKEPSEGGGERSIRMGDSVFSPFLSVVYQPRLSSDVVEILGDPGADGDGGPLPFFTAQSISGQTETEWRVQKIPLSGDDGRLGDNVAHILDGGSPSFAFQLAASDQAMQRTQALAIDRISVSSYNVSVFPSGVQEDVPLQLGADKTYYFSITNTGAAIDTYNVELGGGLAELGNGRPPGQGVTVTASPEQLEVQAGETRRVAVRVVVPREHIHFSGADLEVSIVSTSDSTRIATGKLTFEQVGGDLADFVTTLRVPADAPPSYVEGDEATFIVDVQNIGPRTTLPTDVVLFACPATHSIAQCAEQDLSIRIGSAPLPPLAHGESHSPTFSWIMTGIDSNHIIVAVADPLGIVPEFNPRNSIHWLPIEVSGLERPDLVVHDLRVLDSDGTEVTRAFANDTLRIEATVTNEGRADATGAVFELKNRFSLVEQTFDLRPQESKTIAAQWIAEPGNWIVIARASVGTTEMRLDNNDASWALSIQKGEVRSRWSPQSITLDPGKEAPVTLHLTNTRDQAIDVDLRAATPDPELVVLGLSGSVQIPRGSSIEVPVVVSASPFVTSGRHDVRLDGLKAGTSEVLAASSLDVFVDARRQIGLAHGAIVSAPGTASTDLRLSNGGDAAETVVLKVAPPDGWTATVMQPTLELGPGESRTTRVVLEIPAGTLPGSYHVEVNDGEGLVNRSLPVRVTTQVMWASAVETVHTATDRVDVLVRVENKGNAPGVPSFLLDDAAVPLRIDPVPSAMEPGQVRTHLLTLPMEKHAPGLILPGRDVPVLLDEAVRTQTRTEPLEVTAPPGEIRAGSPVVMRARVHNAAQHAEPSLPVRLWVDGKLVDERHIVLGPGETQVVELRWSSAQAGEHAMTVTTGSGDEAIGRTVILEAAEPSNRGIPAPGAWVAMLVFGILVHGRRRR